MSDLDRVRRDWEQWGRSDPLYAVVTRDGRENGKWDTTEFLADGRQVVDDLIRRVQSLGMPLPSGPALDFGCGVGRLSQALTSHFDEVHGVDISDPMLEQAREVAAGLAHPPTFHSNHDPNLALFDDEKFGFVLSLIVLQHMPSTLALEYVREFLRVLKPGGLAVFQIPEMHRPPESLVDHRRLSPQTRNRLIQLKAHLLRRPTMEMHPIAAAVVLEQVEQAGGMLRAVWPDNLAGTLCLSLTYVVEKR